MIKIKVLTHKTYDSKDRLLETFYSTEAIDSANREVIGGTGGNSREEAIQNTIIWLNEDYFAYRGKEEQIEILN